MRAGGSKEICLVCPVLYRWLVATFHSIEFHRCTRTARSEVNATDQELDILKSLRVNQSGNMGFHIAEISWGCTAIVNVGL
jgi:hypothetical protein